MGIRSKLKTNARRALIGNLQRQIDEAKILSAKLLETQHATREGFTRLTDVEFKVFSQFGEDGIIAYVLSQISSVDESFIEFGVGNYQESNTRFILESKNWRGLVIEATGPDVEDIRSSDLLWKHELTAVHSFVTRENIDPLIRKSGFGGPLGLLSIDIDGNDYWVWESISEVDPTVVVVEYNALWGAERAVTIPYDASFDRMAAHHSGLYFGASLRALWLLAQQKGYELIGSNSHGTNAFFVRRDSIADLRTQSPEEAHVGVRVRQARDRSGKLSYLETRDSIRAMQHLPLVDVQDGSVLNVGDLVENA